MARMLTKEEVERMEEQRELIDRARKAGNATAGMSDEERQRYVFNQAHADAMERRRQRVLADPSAEADTTYRHSVMRDAELRAARAHEAGMQGRELATREEEARQKRFGMSEQGMEAARLNKDAAIRAAELQTASAEKIAGINRDSAMGVAKINTESAEKINEGKDKTAIEVANVNYDTSVDTETVRARAQAAKEYAQEMMRHREVDEKAALEFSQKRSAMITQLINSTKVKGKPRYTEEEAARIIDQRLKSEMPGKPRVDDRFRRY